jgi:hypothetical protein
MATQYAETGCAQAEKDRTDGLYFAAILCPLWNRDKNTFEIRIVLLAVSVCRRLGLLPQGLSAGAVALI